jgi:hypothetical protein
VGHEKTRVIWWIKLTIFYIKVVKFILISL